MVEAKADEMNQSRWTMEAKIFDVLKMLAILDVSEVAVSAGGSL
jgi:hypothetical protein